MTSDGSQRPQANSDAPVILSAGGTGGHMFPAFALAGELQLRNIPVVMVTDGRGAKYKDQYTGIAFHVVRAETLRAGILAKLRLAIELVIGTGQALILLNKLKPRVVVGFGGYPSFPALIAAQVLRIPTVLHEQNAVLGKANKLLAGGSNVLALSLPDMSAIPQAWRSKTIVTGNPVRADIVAIGPYVPSSDQFRLLVLGGSQGASVFSNMVPDAIGLLPENLQKRISVTQQCRAADIATAQHSYGLMGIKVRLETFIRDVPEQLAKCHLLIARSGASTVAETAVAGRPAIFVPYPHHKDQQQKVNAMVLVNAGAALVMDEKTMTAQDLASLLEKLMSDPSHLAKMADAARKTAIPEAVKRLADAILSL